MVKLVSTALLHNPKRSGKNSDLLLAQCDNCRGQATLDRGPSGRSSDYVWNFVVRVANELAKTHPDRKVFCGAYSSYRLPPLTIDTLPDNVLVQITNGRPIRDLDDELHEYTTELREQWPNKTDNRLSLTLNYTAFTNRGAYRSPYWPHVIARGVRACHDVNRFITRGDHPGTDNITIPRYVTATVDERSIDGTSPIQVSETLHEHVDRALAMVDELDPNGDPELQSTPTDIRTMAHMGRYCARRIREATALAMDRETGNHSHQQRAIDELEDAAGAWKRYTDLSEQQYKNSLWLNRVGFVDWDELSQYVLQDIAIAGGHPPESLEQME
ncbi:MAG: hypothetical protein ACODAD_08470 [Planctomycetota bacterium]